MMDLMRRRAQMLAAKKEYIIFADPEVERICIANYSSDGIGVTKQDAANVTSIGVGVFRGNTTITSFDEFQYFTKVTGISGASSSPYGTFANCTNLVSITLPESITGIGTNAFRDCSNLVSINLPQSIANINEGAFRNCSLLEIDINLPNLTTLQRWAFANCTKLKRVLSLGSITSIQGTSSNYGAFNGCSGLTEVVLPSTLTNIAPRSFAGCRNITSITWGQNITTIGEYAFYQAFASDSNIDVNLPSLTGTLSARVFHSSGIKTVSNLGNITAFYGGTNPPLGNCTNLVEVTIPTGVTSIGNNIFTDCTHLKKINGLEHIVTINGDGWVKNCALEGEIHFDDLQTMGAWGFGRGASAITITKVYLPSIVSIGGNGNNNSGGFSNLKQLTEVYIGPNCTTINYHAFQYDTALTTVVVLATTPPSLQSTAFANTNSTFKIYVPYSADHSVLDAYKAATNWSSFASRIYELDENGNIPT